MADELSGASSQSIKNVIVVLSGKGGVGKSTFAVQLALCLQSKGHKVGLLDVDLCGPSVPRMMGLSNCSVFQSSEGWVPIYVDKEQTLSVMSIGFLLQNSSDAVIWRGPKKNAMIKQFLTDVCWQELDYLIIDTPPGTSDEHISVVEIIKQQFNCFAVLVTTPQAVSTGDVRREITFCRKMGISMVGLVENMSGFVCPHCQECSYIFSQGGGKALADELNVKYLGSVPLDPSLTMSLERGESFIKSSEQSATKDAILNIVNDVVNDIESRN